MKRLFATAAVTAGLALGGSVANAAVVEIDFTDLGIFGGANGSTAFGPVTVGGIDVSLSSTGGNMTTNAGDKAGCVDGNTDLSHDLTCDGDGIGIVDDEVSYDQELLTVTLDAGSVTFVVESIEFLDLFSPEGGGPEWAQYNLDGGGFINVSSQLNTGGYVFTAGGSLAGPVSTLDFKTTINAESDFALARITLNTVPEPAALGLFGLGLLGLGAVARRRKIA